ncbi:MAG: TlpA disulfide reductase family protein [Porticoccaceae bacterium]
MKPVTMARRGALFLLIGALWSCSSERNFEVLTGEAADLRSDSRLIMINYWATWCLPCLEEMPELAEFRNEHRDIVEVYAVNYDNPDAEELRKQIEEIGVEIPALVEDPSIEFGYARPDVLPATVVMDRGEVKEML